MDLRDLRYFETIAELAAPRRHRPSCTGPSRR